MGQVVERWGKGRKMGQVLKSWFSYFISKYFIKNNFLYFVCILCCRKLVNNYNLCGLDDVSVHHQHLFSIKPVTFRTDLQSSPDTPAVWISTEKWWTKCYRASWNLWYHERSSLQRVTTFWLQEMQRLCKLHFWILICIFTKCVCI